MRTSSHRHVGTSRGSGIVYLEPLERRRLLSGNVIVAIDAITHEMSIVGDGKANQVQFAVNLDLYTFFITGQSGTKINGSSAPLEPMGFSRVSVRMGKGDDVLRVVMDPQIPGGAAQTETLLRIDTGVGDDRVVFDGFSFSDVMISTGAGRDEVSFANTPDMQFLSINTGAGKDKVTFLDKGYGVSIRRVIIDGGTGKDSVIDLDNLDILDNGWLEVRNIESIA